MNAETLAALRGSIAKWQAIVDSTAAKDRGAANCPLCTLFCRGHHHCKRCPVKARTGQLGCGESPYDDWIDHQTAEHMDILRRTRQPGCAECLRLAKAELAFLESLLPEGDK